MDGGAAKQKCLPHLLRGEESRSLFTTPAAIGHLFAKQLRRLIRDSIRMTKAKQHSRCGVYLPAATVIDAAFKN